MRLKQLLLPLLLVQQGTFLLAQKNSFYAIGAPNEQMQWLQVEAFGKGAAERQVIYNHLTQPGIFPLVERANPPAGLPLGPSSHLMAALGYSAGTRQLFFMPIFQPELRWVDLGNPGQPRFHRLPLAVMQMPDPADPGQHITRMTIGANQMGYALSNDARHFYAFTTGAQPQLTELGPLRDAPGNGGNSLFNACTSWGGDLVATTDGDLLLFTQRNYVYRIDPSTRLATWLGQVQGLPVNFTSNGAAADENGQVLLACSVGNHTLYRVNPLTLQAEALPGEELYNYSDMASSYLAQGKNRSFVPAAPQVSLEATTSIRSYPNPVINNRLLVRFDPGMAGRYHLQVLDVNGRILSQQVLQLSGSGLVTELPFDPAWSRGTYLLQVTGESGGRPYMQKIVLQ
ncbi:MAG TPA: T9SS type A sorting domain-containing protein [Lacibacter sp.]|nr:T9SS type A sorting domain-containing protein [Lacibacter sp.]HMO89774.1 T9SS type A sorting domain-containing protein [Lacibacter sp.]